MSESKYVYGNDTFLSDEVTPVSIVYKFKKGEATLIYNEDQNHKKRFLTKPFSDIFNVMNSNILHIQNDFLLPSGCIFHDVRSNGKESFLMEGSPSIRTFRLTETDKVKDLVTKMFNKFVARTKVLKMNPVEEGAEEARNKEIYLREKYIEQQVLRSRGQYTFKLIFRVYFPYTYINISVKRAASDYKESALDFGGMMAAISLTPVRSLKDPLYQFPLSNVSKGGSVCTGKLPLGEFGLINVKTYVEKMTSYFWNNRFNADITAGPEIYGDLNCMGNWFEWEYVSYTDPSSVLSAPMMSKDMQNTTVEKFINSGSERDQLIWTINGETLVRCFESPQRIADSYVDLQSGIAKKHSCGIADVITISSFEIPIGTILDTGKKKFKVKSFDGYTTYNVGGNTLTEDEIVITHVVLVDQQKRIYRIPLNDKGTNFISSAFLIAKNFVVNAQIGNLLYNSGGVVADMRNEILGFDIVKTIRSKDDTFFIKLQKSENEISINSLDHNPAWSNKNLCIRPVEFKFGTEYSFVDNGEKFLHRNKKLLKRAEMNAPHIIREFLSDEMESCLEIVDARVEVRNTGYRNYSYEKSAQVVLKQAYAGQNGRKFTDVVLERYKHPHQKREDGKIDVVLPMPETVTNGKFVSHTPLISKSEVIIFGHKAYMAIPSNENESVGIKIMTNEDGKKRIVAEDSTAANRRLQNLFMPSINQLKSTISEIDGIKTFMVRDIFESQTDHEYITFKVGDEVISTLDWNSEVESPLSIKKIYDFISIENISRGSQLEVSLHTTNNRLLERTDISQRYIMVEKYKKYLECDQHHLDEDERIKRIQTGTIYAVLIDNNENIQLYPLIDSLGKHYLNGISHIEKEVEGIKIGDFVKADTPKIPYFAKKNVDEIVAFVTVNNRKLAIMKCKLTMWVDILKSHFNVYKREKLTSAKINFYKEKVRNPEGTEEMIMFGDYYLSQIGIPIYTRSDIQNFENSGETMTKIINTVYASENLQVTPNTIRLSKKDIEDLISHNNGSTHFHTIAPFVQLTRILPRVQRGMSSFRVSYSSRLGEDLESNEIGSLGDGCSKTYDLAYSVLGRSLNNGNAYLDARTTFYPQSQGVYYYYESPYRFKDPWLPRYGENRMKVHLLTFPTPRILKSRTRESGSYTCFRLLGPQNIFYNELDDRGQDGEMMNDELMFNITSDKMFPEIERD